MRWRASHRSIHPSSSRPSVARRGIWRRGVLRVGHRPSGGDPPGGRCWFRAGSEGIAFRLPYKSRPQTLLLTHKIAEVALPWKDVRKIYPLHYKVNGIPFGKSLMVDTVEGRFNFGGYFKESPAVIIATLRDAGSA